MSHAAAKLSKVYLDLPVIYVFEDNKTCKEVFAMFPRFLKRFASFLCQKQLMRFLFIVV